MFLDKILNRTSVLEKTMDASWLRNEVISNNISNVDTPGFKRSTVTFEQQLSQAMDNSSFKGFRNDPRHIPIGGTDIGAVKSDVVQDNKSLSYRLDNNNVDIENEMALLAKNSIQYSVLTQSLSNKFRSIKSVINEGRR